MEQGSTPGSVFLHPRDGSPCSPSPPASLCLLPDTSQMERKGKVNSARHNYRNIKQGNWNESLQQWFMKCQGLYVYVFHNERRQVGNAGSFCGRDPLGFQITLLPSFWHNSEVVRKCHSLRPPDPQTPPNRWSFTSASQLLLHYFRPHHHSYLPLHTNTHTHSYLTNSGPLGYAHQVGTIIVIMF